MAPSKPLHNATTSLANIPNNTVKKYGHSQQHHQQQQYIPVTPSPLNPRSSSRARPTTLPRRHTVSGPAPTPSTQTATSTSTPVVPRPVRHTRRHSGSSSSVSPTERLMRYKGALAWRSATLRRQNTPAEREGPCPHSDADGHTASLTTQKSENSTNEKEKSDFHVVFLNQPETRDKDKESLQSPLSYHPVVEYYHPYSTDYTSTTTRPRAVFRRPRGAQGSCYGCSSHITGTTTTTLQRAGFVAVAFLFGIYMLLHAFSLVIGRGTGTSTGSPNSDSNSNSHSLLGVPTRGNASWDMSQGYYR